MEKNQLSFHPNLIKYDFVAVNNFPHFIFHKKKTINYLNVLRPHSRESIRLTVVPSSALFQELPLVAADDLHINAESVENVGIHQHYNKKNERNGRRR